MAMRSWIAFSGLAVALATVAWLVVGRSSADEASGADEPRPASSSKADEVPRQRARDGSLETRVAVLEDEVDALRREIRGLRARPVASPPSPSSLDAFPGEPAFEHAVRNVVEQERAREEEARLERRRDQWEARLESLSTELAERAGLGNDEQEQIAALWSAEAEEILPLIAAARSGEGSFRDVREQMDVIRARTDEQAASLLSAAQQEIYEELRPRGPGGRGGRGGRGDREARSARNER